MSRILIPLIAAVIVLAVPLTAPVAASVATDEVRSVPVSFTVDNVNRSALSCASDGRRVTLRGRLIGTDAALRSASAATLYLHEFSFGRFFWDFGAVPGYDHAGELARDGHVAVVIDRLGYDESDRPAGLDTCVGAQADMAAQVLRALREGRYTSAGPAPRFTKVILAGHSVGAAAAELALHSFPDLDAAGLMVFAWADRGFTRRTVEQSADQGARCTAGGEPSDPGQPSGYAFFGNTEQEFQANVFANADPRVVAAATRMRNRDPCGDAASLTQASAVNASRLGMIDVPVLLLFGERDAVFEPSAARQQADAFTGSRDVTLRTFARSGHALTLDADAAAVRATTEQWLAARWPVGSGAGTGPAGGAPATLPGRRDCRSRRVLRVTLRGSRRVLRATVLVDGRVQRVVRRPRRTVRVSLRGLPRRAVTVRIVVRYTDGTTRRTTRRYRTCAPSA